MQKQKFFVSSSHLTFVCAALAWGALPGAAYAQTTDADAAADNEARSDEIVVTARRVEENLQDVPVAITAFSQLALERKSITSALDLNKAVPGLTVSAGSGNSTLAAFSIRGRGQFFGAASGSVETYFADVPLSAPFEVPTLPAQFFDIASVQVLKGPQGTLFGRNTTGGAVLIVPAAPTFDGVEGYVRVQGGTRDNVQLEGAINLPLSDKVAIRAAGFFWHRKGYTFSAGGLVDPYGQTLPDQYYDNQDVAEGRLTILLEPSDTFSNSTILTYHSDHNRSATQVDLVNTTTPSFYGGVIAAFYPEYATDGPRVGPQNIDLSRESNVFALINTTTLEVSDTLTLKNIFGYVNSKGFGNPPGTADGTPLALVDLPRPSRALRNFQTTNEIQLQGTFDQFDFIVGGLIDLTRQPGSNDKINIVTNSFPSGAAFNQIDQQFRVSRFTSYSAFANGTYHLANQLNLSLGIRHTWDDISERSCEYNPPLVGGLAVSALSAADCAATVHPDGSVGFVSGQKNFKGLSYAASLDYAPGNGTLIYGGYRHGYKRGGFNAKGNGLALFAPETVDNFYFGLKQDLDSIGLRGHFNIEGFWDLYTNAQRSYLAIDPGIGALTTVVQNAPKSTYRGFDMDFSISPSDFLELTGNYTFVDAYYRSFPDNTCTLVVGGVVNCIGLGGLVPNTTIQAINPGDQGSNPLGLVSRNKLSMSARFHTELSNGMEIAFTPTYSYQSRFYINDQAFRQPNAGVALFGPTNSAAAGATFAPSYSLIDLRLELNHIAGSDIDLALNVNNLTNKTFVLGGVGVYQLGYNAVTYGPPRLWTAEVKFRF